jgi:hypothetical protein
VSEGDAPHDLAAHQPKRWIALHHLLLALTLASIMVIAARSPIYFQFDLLTHALLSYYGLGGDAESGERKTPLEPVSEDLKAVLPHFVVASPRLEALMSNHPGATRRYDTDVLAAILSQRPRVVAVSNLDLAPWNEPGEDPDASADQAQADDVLDGAAARGTQVILSFPLPKPQWPSLESYRIAWIVKRCAAGVLFGIPALGLRHDGVIDEGSMLYRQHYPSLGVVAAEVASRRTASERAADSRAGLVCELAKEADGDVKKFMDMLVAKTDLSDETANSSEELNREIRFVNHQFFRALPAAKFSRLDYGRLENGRDGIFPPDVLPGEVVFWSSNVSSGVERTAAGDAPGYFRDALVYFSERRPIARASHAVAFLADVLLGVILGYLFAFLWRRYAIAAEILNRVALLPARRKLVAWIKARIWLVVAIGVLPVILWLLLLAAEWWTLRGQWLNPLPIVVGMFIDGLMQSRQRAGDPHPHNLGEYVSRHVDVLLIQLPLIAVAIYFLIRSH